jgi:hypothetical protein
MRTNPEVAMTLKTLSDVVTSLLNGLVTDGAHHKQYYLELALKNLVTDEYLEQCRLELQWDEGIAP